MKRQALSLFIALFIPALLFAAPPTPNLETLTNQINHYYASGQYARDVTRRVKPAERYLAYRIENNPTHQKLAVVFDIDDTLISNYRMTKKFGFGATQKVFDAQMLYSKAPIKPMRKLFNFAKKHGVTIFLITGRPENYRQATAKNLRLAGYSGWQHLYLKPLGKKFPSAADYKTPIRKKLEKRGYDIVISAGDQYSDLKGGYSDMNVKLPNPVYIIP